MLFLFFGLLFGLLFGFLFVLLSWLSLGGLLDRGGEVGAVHEVGHDILRGEGDGGDAFADCSASVSRWSSRA